MKITIITSPFGYIPPHGYGAVEKIWYDLAGEMIKEGHSVSFISKEYKEELKDASINDISTNYIKGYSWTGSLKKDLVLDFIYSFKALYTLKKTDILIFNTFWTPLICFLFWWKYDKTVYNVARFPKGQFRFFKHINRLACVSSAVYNELLVQTPSVKNISKVISNPVNTDVFKYSKEFLETTKFRVVYTGRVHPEKGLTILVKSCNLLVVKYPNLELVIVGPRSIANGGGGDKYVEKLNELASSFSVNWCDPISDSRLLKEEIVRSTIFCYPSIAEKGETFGVSPLEAMAAGRATIVSNLTCFKDFVVDNENGLIFNHSLENPELDLYNKIEALINNVDLRKKIAINGAKTALNFSNKKIAKEYLEDFYDLLKK